MIIYCPKRSYNRALGYLVFSVALKTIVPTGSKAVAMKPQMLPALAVLHSRPNDLATSHSQMALQCFHLLVSTMHPISHPTNYRVPHVTRDPDASWVHASKASICLYLESLQRHAFLCGSLLFCCFLALSIYESLDLTTIWSQPL